MSDLISRQAAIDLICDQKCGIPRKDCPLTYEKDGCEACNEVALLEVLPAVDSVKHGRWEQCIVDGYGGKLAVITCSVCNTSGIGGLPYCPYCGARMDGEENG